MILTFQPSPGSADIPFHFIGNKYDLSDGSLSPFKDEYTGYYSAESFLSHIELILACSDCDTIVIRREKSKNHD